MLGLLTFAGVGCTDSDKPSDTTKPANGATEPTEVESSVEFKFTPLDGGGPKTKAALENGDIDVAVLFSSDVSISKNEWVALADDKHIQPADNVVPVIRTDATSSEIVAVLDAISAKLDNPALQAMVTAVSDDGENPEDVASKFLEDNELPGDLKATGNLTVGANLYTESEVISQIYGQALKTAGVSIEFASAVDGRDPLLQALEAGDIDLAPEFSGSLLGSDFIDAGEVSAKTVDEQLEVLKPLTEKHDFTVLEASAAFSVNTFVVTQETADKYELVNVSDLVDVKDELTLGGPTDCPIRDICIKGLEEVYGLKFKM